MSGEIVLMSSGTATAGLAVITGGAALLAVYALIQAQANRAAQLALAAEAKQAAWQEAQTTLQTTNAVLEAQLARVSPLSGVLASPAVAAATVLPQTAPPPGYLADEAQVALAALPPQQRQQIEQTVVSDQLSTALHSLGYTTVQAFDPQASTHQAYFGIPGGEQLRVALMPDLRLAFAVTHERTAEVTGPLDAQELAFLTQQEARWCRDLPKLIAKLDAAGIRYQFGFERPLTAARIPVVTVESAAAWEAQQNTPTEQQSP